MPHDNVIDFGSLKRRHNSQKGESIESDAAFQAEMEATLDKIPAHMQEFVGRRFTFLTRHGATQYSAGRTKGGTTDAQGKTKSSLLDH